jgi:hypothetical protein
MKSLKGGIIPRLVGRHCVRVSLDSLEMAKIMMLKGEDARRKLCHRDLTSKNLTRSLNIVLHPRDNVIVLLPPFVKVLDNGPL